MKKALLFLIVLYTSCTFAQHTVSKKWDARFGGTDEDDLVSIALVTDGGYILGGTSASPLSGDKTQSTHAGGADYWIVKIDAGGHYLWDRQYGGTGDDRLTAIYATVDGGCIIGGTSTSDSTGDMSQHSRGGFDFWVVKVDAQGNKQWDKRFGGSGGEFLYALEQTRDGGYILGGRSSSGINGDKTQNCRGLNDYWMVKTDSMGIKQWDKRFGTVNDEACVSIIQTYDGGFLLGGTTATDTSFDKSEPNFDTQWNTPRNIWILKTDSLGTKLWDRVYGTTDGNDFGALLNTSDSNYLIGGGAYSDISGNKTTAKCGFWIIKVTPAGIKLGDWAFGAGLNCGQTLKSMTPTSDRGYLLTGVSGPGIEGDKTEDNLSQLQVWTIKIDSQMNRVWDKTSLTLYTDIFQYDISAGILGNSTNCYTVGVSTTAGIGGDKSQPNWEPGDSLRDYWIVQYCDTVLTAITETVGDVHFSIYPVPTAREVSIHLEYPELHEATFTLTSPTGQLIYHSTETALASSYTKILDLGTLPSGLYLLDITTSGQHITRRILKE